MTSTALLMTTAILVPWLYHTALKVNKAVHYLQLNGYFSGRYVRWLANNTSRIMTGWDLLPALVLVLWSFQPPAAVVVTWMVLYMGVGLIYFRTRRQEGEKKRLVYTARVKRLLSTIGILMALVIAGAVTLIFLQRRMFYLLLGLFLLNLLAFAVTGLANLLNWPLERGINRWYYRDAARILNQQNNLRVIGITGSYGKTSTKHSLNRILAERFNVLATPESYNTTMGVILTTRTMLRPTDQVFIVEMGAKKKGDIKEICDLVHPDMAILTAIGEQHLETFKDLENIKQTKFELIQSLKPGGTAFINADDANIRSLPRVDSIHYVRYGIDAEEADYRAGSIQYDSRGTKFTVTSPRGHYGVFRTRLLGRHNIYNILAATAVACELGMDLATVALAVKKLTPVEHRLEVKRGHDYVIIDDAFNSNPVGSRMALEVLSKIEGSTKIMITPGMVELGAKEYELNYAFGRAAADVCDYLILVGPRQTQPIQQALKEQSFPSNRYFIAKNLNQALEHLNGIAKPGSVVLFENDLPDTYNE